MRKTRRLRGDLLHFCLGRKAEAVLQRLHTNAQSGNFAGLVFSLYSLGKAIGELEGLGRFPNGNGREAYQEQGWA